MIYVEVLIFLTFINVNLMEGYLLTLQYGRPEQIQKYLMEKGREKSQAVCLNYAYEFMKLQEFGPNCKYNGKALKKVVEICCDKESDGCHVNVFTKYFCQDELCEKTCLSRALYATQKTVNEVMSDAPPLAKAFMQNIVTHVPELCITFPKVCTEELEILTFFHQYLIVRLDLLNELMMRIIKTGLNTVVKRIVNPNDPRYQQFDFNTTL
ncbi:unnamed protein product [Auanema sp. JU1783]|nr:unnamed protein product [Auanema sp. JU1783]